MLNEKVRRNHHSRDQWSTLVLYVVFVTNFTLSFACPDKCECFDGTVKCVNQGLTAIPKPLPEDTKILFVTGNNILNVSPESFPNPLLELTSVHLSDNGIEEIDSFVFNNVPKLSFLDLSNNIIRKVNKDAFGPNNVLLTLNLRNSLFNYSYSEEIACLLNSATKLTSLDLSNNEMVLLPQDMFSSLLDLTSLDLRNNSIVFVSNGTLRNPRLQQLDLRNNALKELPNATIADLSGNPNLRLRLFGNAWLCDCNIADMQDWLRKTDQVLDKGNLTCNGPNNLRGESLLQVDTAQLQCNYDSNLEGVLETSYVFLGMVLALIGVIFLLVLYLNRKGIKRWMYNIRDACRDHMEGYHYRYEINTDPRLANLSLNSDV